MLKIMKKNKKTLIFLIFMLLFPISILAQVNIMPMGNSITKGLTGSTDGSGYRDLLLSTLNGYGYSVDFVGELDWGGTDPNTESYQGWKTTDLIEAINGTKTTNPSGLGTTPLFSHIPTDIVLLHIGTNDIEASSTPSDIANNVNTILGNIQSQDANIVVVLARVILDDNDNQGVNGAKATITKEYNSDLVSTAVNRIINNNDKLIVVNMQDAIIYPSAGASLPSPGNQVSGTDIFYDINNTLLHPYQTGYDKMAIVWANAVDGYFTDKSTLISPISASTNHFGTDTLAWGLTQNAVSYRLQISDDNSHHVEGDFNANVYNVGDGTITEPYKILNGFLSSTTYWWRIQPLNAGLGNLGSNSVILNFTTFPLYVNAKVYLQGPYSSGTMRTTINSILPQDDPYSQGEHVSSR